MGVTAPRPGEGGPERLCAGGDRQSCLFKAETASLCQLRKEEVGKINTLTSPSSQLPLLSPSGALNWLKRAAGTTAGCERVEGRLQGQVEVIQPRVIILI